MAYKREGEVIVSRQNRRIVALCKLSDRKAREEAGLFRFDGIKLLCEALRRGVELDTVYLRTGSVEHVEERMTTLYGCALEDITCPIIEVDDGLFDKISEENAPEGVITVAKYIDRFHKKYIIKKEADLTVPDGPVFLLDAVRDPGNVGAIIRSAAALGIRHMILSSDCADLYHPRTLRAAMGPLFSMSISRVDDLAATVTLLRRQGRRVFAAALDDQAVRLGDVEFLSNDCAVVGNEGHGISPAVIEAATQTLYIPMQADTESLNASIAAALVMWELCR